MAGKYRSQQFPGQEISKQSGTGNNKNVLQNTLNKNINVALYFCSVYTKSQNTNKFHTSITTAWQERKVSFS